MGSGGAAIRTANRPEGAIELDEGEQFIAAHLRQPELGVEEIAIGIERAQQRVDAAFVAHVRQPRSIAQRRDEGLLLRTDLADFLILHERVGHFAKRRLDDPLVLNERNLLLRLRELHVGSQAAAIEHRLRHLRYELPHAGWTGEEARQLIALEPEQPRQTDARQIRRPRDVDQRARRGQRLFGGTDVRTTGQERGGHSRWHLRQRLLTGEGTAARYGTGIVAD